jgi:hypothetical protein
VNIVESLPTSLLGFKTQEIKVIWKIPDKPVQTVVVQAPPAQEKPVQPQEVQLSQVQKWGNVSVTSENFDAIVERIFMFLEEGEWERADYYCEQALNFKPKHGALYFAKLMAELHAGTKEDLKKQKTTFDSNSNAVKAGKFDPELACEIEKINDFIRETNERDSLQIVDGELKKYSGSSESLIIPDTVKTIGKEAFKSNKTITSITIPDSVTSIGESAFLCCTKLTDVTIGNGVTEIGEHVFDQCTGLKSITIPDSVTSIGKYAFAVTGLTSITIPDSVTSIGECAFYKCSELKSITIPDSVTSIDEYAFYKCSELKSITFPGSVTSIGKGVINDCTRLEELQISAEQFKKYYDCFKDSPFINTRIIRNVCAFCGGEYKGLFMKKCSKCGMEKNF